MFECRVWGCYYPSELSVQSNIYKFAYGRGSLSDPRVLNGVITPFRLVARLLARVNKNGDGGLIEYFTDIDSSRQFRFRWANTQFHSVYFDRFKHCYEPEVTAVIQAVLGDSQGGHRDCFWDVGANWGHFVGVAGAVRGFSGQIVAVEPNVKVVDDLRAFLRAAKLEERTMVVPEAFGDCEQVGKLVSPDRFHSGTGELHPVDATFKGDAVRVQAPDSLVLPRPTLVKIDVEGSEGIVLDGMKFTIDESKCFIVFESFYGPDRRSTLKPYRVLRELGYRFFQVVYNIIRKVKIAGKAPFVDLEIALLEHSDDSRAALQRKLNVLAIHDSRVSEFQSIFTSYCEQSSVRGPDEMA